MKIKAAYSVGGATISTDIYKLPCIEGVLKGKDGKPIYFTRSGISRRYVFPGDWICQDQGGRWQVLTDEEYKTITTP